MTEQKPERLPGTWVKLHLERQSEGSTMPPYIIGFLTKESANAYVLTKVMLERYNDETFENEYIEAVQHHHVNRTYVWNCEVLGERPIATDNYNGEGGLG